MIGSNADVGSTLLDHRQDRTKDPADGSYLLSAGICCAWQREEMPEQLIGPVNQIHIHDVQCSGYVNSSLRDERLPKGPRLHPSPGKSGAVRGPPRFASESLDADTANGSVFKLTYYLSYV